MDGRKVRISRRSSEIKQTGCRERRNNPRPFASPCWNRKKMGVGAPIDQATFVEHPGESYFFHTKVYRGKRGFIPLVGIGSFIIKVWSPFNQYINIEEWSSGCPATKYEHADS